MAVLLDNPTLNSAAVCVGGRVEHKGFIPDTVFPLNVSTKEGCQSIRSQLGGYQMIWGNRGDITTSAKR